MNDPEGVKGYSKRVQDFIRVTQSISFDLLHQDFLDFLPKERSIVLDLGAGIGRDAFVLAEQGYSVIAVEPLNEFREEGKKLYISSNLRWINDSLPYLNKLHAYKNKVDFVLVSGVWHHLEKQEQKEALFCIASILKKGGRVAISLRNGPSGLGNNIFPTEVEDVVQVAEQCRLELIFSIKNQESLLKNKKDVKWSRLVFQKEG